MYPSITPGRVTSTWRIIQILHYLTESKKESLLELAKSTYLRAGGLPIDDGYLLCGYCDYINVIEDKITLSAKGLSIAQLSSDKEPTIRVRRRILFDFINLIKPSWISIIDTPIRSRMHYIPSGWREILMLSNLHKEPLDDEATEWWKSVEDLVIRIDEINRKIIGDIGENLTIEFEKKRLKESKLSDYLENIIQVSQEKDGYGYDIQSINAGLIEEIDWESKIMIEVKSSTSLNIKKFRFYLTKNEWRKAVENKEKYKFYFWRGIDKNRKTAVDDIPYILSVNEIEPIIPKDIHPDGEWTECRLIVDLS